MVKIGETNIYVGTKEEYQTARQKGMKIVCALNRAKGYVSHQSVVGWSGKGCNKNNPHYLFKQQQNAIYLNMFDTNNPQHIKHEMINKTLSFMHNNLQNNEKVFVYCSKGESRAPSIALMYMLEYNLVDKNNKPLTTFKNKLYPAYKPKKGIYLYIKNRWNL
ncbi:MAG: dual specificity protein phosphatase family protein [Actinomycetota bacterium]|nr:dual specificity protein phosphatase family protein [Actinomycetota bacterium]